MPANNKNHTETQDTCTPAVSLRFQLMTDAVWRVWLN